MQTQKQFRKRNAILAYLRQTKEHPSAEMVYNRLKPEFPDLSLGTVYRNLAIFKNQGQIVSLGSVCGVERFDGDVRPHAHFVCSGCGAVVDMPEAGVPDCSGAARDMGCRVEHAQLILTGLCRDCLSRKNN